MATVEPQAERIRRLAPDAIRMGMQAATREITLRFRGLEFARWRLGEMWFGLGDHQQLLTPERWPALEALIRQMGIHRHPLASDTKAPALPRATGNVGSETLISADPGKD